MLKKSFLAASIILSSLGTSFADGILPAERSSQINIFGGGGLLFTNNIQTSGSLLLPNGVVKVVDAGLVASNTPGAGNVGIGYSFNPYFGVDFNYTYRGAQDFGVNFQSPSRRSYVFPGTAETQSYAIEALASLPLNLFKPYVKVGYARYTTDWKFTSNAGLFNGNITYNENGNAVVYGVGTQYHLNKSFDVVAFVDGISTDKHEFLNKGITQYYAGLNLQYHFAI